MESTARIECFNTRKSLLFDLQPKLIMTLFRHWLKMKDVARFDTAICNKEYRLYYLSLLSSGEITFEGSKYELDILHGDCLEWLIARKVGIRSLSCSSLNRFEVADVTGRMLLKIAKLSGLSLTRFCLVNWWDGFSASLMSQFVTYCSNIETLEYVNCSKKLINDALVISACFRLSNLKDIDISNGSISDRTLETLASHCPMLVNVSFKFCKKITDAGLKALARGCPCLKRIDLNDLHHITDEGIIDMARGCKQLRYLELCQGDWITNASMERDLSLPYPMTISLLFCHHLTSSATDVLADHSEQLCHINICGCRQLTEPSLIYFIEKLSTNLLEIDLGFSKFVTNAILHTIAHMCPKLRTFAIQQNDLITDDGVVELIKSCEFLCCIELYCCTNISDVVLDAIACHSVHWEYLRILGCPLVTRKSLNQLQDKKPDLVIFDSGNKKEKREEVEEEDAAAAAEEEEE